MITSDEIKELAHSFTDVGIQDRRHIHQHPELSFHEEETAKYISSTLNELDIDHTSGRGGHGIVGFLGKATGMPSVALRADMDALPIQEGNDVEYRSKVPGVMHACGHDVHTASLLGACRILKQVESRLPGQVKLIFQPAEEKLPGGASILIKEGVLSEEPTSGCIFGQHVHPPLEAGKIGVKPGIYMASADEIYLEVVGKGGHAAVPRDFIDPIAISSQIVIALQQLVSRSSDPSIPSVLSFGKIGSDGGATNVIPERVFLEGTFRTLDEEWRREAHDLIKTIAERTANAFGGCCQVEVRKGYPYLYNDPPLTERFREAAMQYVGEANVVDLPIRMTAEDFAYYSHNLPACFYRLGTKSGPDGPETPVHTSTFDIDESAIETGIGMLAWAAITELQHMHAE